jgi:protein-disulfide isomerase
MSKGSAIILTVIAFAFGLLIGHLTGSSGGHGDTADSDIHEDGVEVAAAPDDGIERYRIAVTDRQPTKGPEDALVTIVEFSEFQCPFCSRVLPTMAQIREQYGNKVRFVWRNNPLGFHQNAMPAAEAVMEAFAQGGNEKFWQLHDLLFENQRALERANLETYAQRVGLNMERFRAALDNGTHRAAVQQDQQLANTLGARGTPHFFINGRKLAGAQPIERFREVIDDEIRRAEQLVESGTPRNRVYAALTRGGLTKAGPPAPPPGAAQKAPPQQRRQPDPNAVYRVPVSGEPQRGPNNALVTIVEFSDFECPFCTRVEPTVNQIVERYGNDVRIVWMNNPLPFHQNAGPAAQAALEAFDQGGNTKFWAMHALLFENQRALGRENLEQYAQQIGLNMTQFRAALDNNEHQATITRQQALARGLGASGTPSFFINGRNLRGAQPFEAFQRVIDEELAKARQKVQSGTPRARVYAATIADGATEAQFLAAPAAAPAAAQKQAPDADRVYEIAVPDNAPFKGGRNARVVIQLFSDFQCPFCTRIRPTLEQIEETYGNRVKIVWRNYPLPFHQQAMPAAEASLEVFAQRGSDAFWRYHDLLFENQRALERANLETYAQQIGGIDMARFRRALDNNTHRAAVQADMDAVRNAGARIGTPSAFINGRLIQGAQPFPAFQAAIDRALAAR